MSTPLSRRDLLAAAGAGLPWLAGARATPPRQDSSRPPAIRNMGAEGPGFRNRSRAGGFDILEHAHTLGLGAVRLGVPRGGPDAVRAVRRKLDAYGMRCIVSVPPPKTDAEVAGYDSAIAAARELGAVTTHASFTGRRYEEFDTFEAFKASFEAHKKSVERAEPVLRKHRMRLAIENHKGWRAAEHAAWVRQVGSEYVGVCYDFGNNIALCEEPSETYRLLAPLTIYVSFKDMAVAPYEDGFLLSEVALGDGILDIPGMVKGLQARDPDMIFALEMITREPLQVPVFTKKYWVTFDDEYSPLPGRDLARVLELVRSSKKPLTTTEGLTPEQALKLEDDLIARSITYARTTLTL